MKKLISFILLILLSVAFVGCNSEDETTTNNTTNVSTTNLPNTDTTTEITTTNTSTTGIITQDTAMVISLRELLDSYLSTSYYTYNSDSELIYGDGSVVKYSIDSNFEVFYDKDTLENMFHFYSETERLMGTSTIYSDDTYFYYDHYGVSLATYHDYISDIYITPGNEPDWEITYYSYQEQREMGLDKNQNTFDFGDLLNEIHDVEYSTISSNYVIEIPLTTDNFSITTFPELMALLNTTYIGDFLETDQMVEIINQRFSQIDLSITVNHDFTEIILIKIDLTNLINDLYRFLDPNIVNDPCSAVYIEITDLSNQSITFESPFFLNEYTDSGNYIYDIDGEVNDAYIDTENSLIVYSVIDDNNLYFFNYDTYEITEINFSIKPDQITGDDGYIYVTLSDLHIRTAEDPQYGGIAVIDISDLSVVNTFDYNFDPYDIAVDDDGYLYVTHGSDQHGDLRGIDSTTGEVVYHRSGFYYLGQVVYSSYTNRIYYTEIMTTSDDLEVYDVDHGVFGAEYQGSEDFTEESLTVSPDGHYIYSLDGKIFMLNPTITLDGKIWDDLEFDINGVAFDMTNSISYFAREDGIYAMNSNGEFSDIYKYGLSSIRMAYSDGLLLNVANSHIEIINTINTDNNVISEYIDYNYGEPFNPNQYFINNGFIGYDIELISGEITNDSLGSFEMIYQLTNDSNTYNYYLLLNIVDVEAPEISIDINTSFNIELNETFIPPICNVTDNFDENPMCTISYNDVNTSEIGLYTVTYTAEDSSGNISNTSYQFSVGLNDLEYNVDSTSFDGNIYSAVYSEEDNTLFYSLPDENQIVCYNFDTETETRLNFDYSPEYLLLHNGKIYAAIVHDTHSMYWNYEDQNGEIAIIDASTCTLDSLNYINVDPYTMVVIGNYIYISLGSGQHIPVVSYNLNGFTDRHELYSFSWESIITSSNNSNYIFLITTQSLPQSLFRLTVSNGVLTDCTDDPGHGDYIYGEEVFSSYDGTYVFSNNGQAFYQNAPTNGQILDYAFNLPFDISGYLYNDTNNVSIFGDSEGILYFSNPDSLEIAYQIAIDFPIDEIFGSQSQLFIISYGEESITFITVSMDK